jgi:hypothetical protein
VDTVRADHFHMLTDVFKAAHLYLLQALTRLNAPPPTGMHAAASAYACLGHESSPALACDASPRRLSPSHG